MLKFITDRVTLFMVLVFQGYREYRRRTCPHYWNHGNTLRGCHHDPNPQKEERLRAGRR